MIKLPFINRKEKKDKKEYQNILLKTKSSNKKDFVTLVILDGLGIHPDPEGNSLIAANTPFLDTVWSNALSTQIHASGTFVGLPLNEQGNSEVGHLNIGAGRVVQQSLPRINESIENGSFADLDILKEAFNTVKKNRSNLHLIGILSAGGVHGHIKHLFTLLDICKSRGVDPYIHAFLDGRDTGMTDGYYYISKTVERIKKIGVGKISSMSGRFFSMDRDKRWERTELAYNSMVGEGKRKKSDLFTALQEAYKNGENDQIFTPTTIVDKSGNPVGPIRDNDVVIFFNYREDRARQITKVLMLDEFDYFERINHPKNLFFVTMTGYERELNTKILFPPKLIENTLSDVVANAGMSQLHMSETEKNAHVTYFFNGGKEELHPGEKVYNIPSPKVFDYSKVPEMSSYLLRDQLIYELDHRDKNPYSFYLINFANPDMVGHTGNFEATVKANEIVDQLTEEVVRKSVESNGAAIIIGDHGNCETMIDRMTKKIDTAHTDNPVPCIIVTDESDMKGSGNKIHKIGRGPRADSVTGILADVAPTTLSLLDLSPSTDMTGVDLISAIT
ncbi:MAG TPA: 2,3-bisphosphoglycerate-independent phosphoglycerate mutase [bacterium]|nr:2,3-bisphosphoglycerate-independent phosphoglycerate mutase [bacterium]